MISGLASAQTLYDGLNIRTYVKSLGRDAPICDCDE